MIEETKNKFQLMEPVKAAKDQTKKQNVQLKATIAEANTLK